MATYLVCSGRMVNGPGKTYVRCPVCGCKDYEKNEGDRCGGRRAIHPCGGHSDDAVCGWCLNPTGGCN